MLDYLYDSNPTALVIISLAIIIIAGFLMSRLTKLCKLPNVTGYILAGILIGPYVLNIIPSSIIPSFNFLTDIAVAFIAFGVGKYINLSVLKKEGKKALVLTLFESLISAGLIFLLLFFVFGLSWQISLLLSAIASCTAPTSTLMTIRQYHANGGFINTLIQVIALDNVIGLFAFNVCLVIVQGSNSALSVGSLLLPIVYNVITIILGIILGLVLKLLIKNKYSMDSRLIMTFAIIFLLTAICAFLNISPLLSCMVLGATYVTAKGDNEMFKVVGSFTPPILLIFFVVSGMKFDLTMLLSIGLIGLAYFFVRIFGKMLGSFLGGLTTRSNKDIKKFLGLALIPQAGVSIGLAAIASRVLPTDTASLLTTIILTSAILYELFGPALAKYAIFSTSQIDSRYTPKKLKATPMEQYLNQIDTKNSKISIRYDKITKQIKQENQIDTIQPNIQIEQNAEENIVLAQEYIETASEHDILAGELALNENKIQNQNLDSDEQPPTLQENTPTENNDKPDNN